MDTSTEMDRVFVETSTIAGAALQASAAVLVASFSAVFLVLGGGILAWVAGLAAGCWAIKIGADAYQMFNSLDTVRFVVKCSGRTVSWTHNGTLCQVDLSNVTEIAFGYGEGEAELTFKRADGSRTTLTRVPFSKYSELFDYLRAHFQGVVSRNGRRLGSAEF